MLVVAKEGEEVAQLTFDNGEIVDEDDTPGGALPLDTGREGRAHALRVEWHPSHCSACEHPTS